MDTTGQHLLTEETQSGDLTINDLDLAAYVPHIHILCLLMEPLNHISTRVDNTTADVWARRGSVI